HDYQEITVEDAANFLQNSRAGERKLYASPTGSGKGVIEAALLRRLRTDTLLVTPRVEIIHNILDKLGHEVTGMNPGDLLALADAEGIVTPIRLRNALARCVQQRRPKQLILDECHHHNAATYREIDAMLGGIPTVGFT